MEDVGGWEGGGDVDPGGRGCGCGGMGGEHAFRGKVLVYASEDTLWVVRLLGGVMLLNSSTR